jgi:hypothetical protein
MELVTHKKMKNGRLMPWGKGTVVSGAKGFVYLSGNTATADDYDPPSVKREAAQLAMQPRSGARSSRTSNRIWRNSVAH